MGSMQCLLSVFVAIILEHYAIQSQTRASSYELARFARVPTLGSNPDVWACMLPHSEL